MISLLFDTSSSHLLVSIVKEDVLLAYTKIEDIRGLSTRLLEEIDRCIQKSGISLSQIDTIFIVNGPGSFTGLRVGVTVAKVMAYTAHKKIIPISSLELMATTPFDGDYIVPYIDARRGYVYAGVYDKELNIIKEDSYISVENLLASLDASKKIIFVGNTEVDKISSFIKPHEDVKKIITKHIEDTSVSPHRVNPNYLKLTEAEEKRKHD